MNNPPECQASDSLVNYKIKSIAGEWTDHDYLAMDARFCRAMRNALDSGLEQLPPGRKA